MDAPSILERAAERYRTDGFEVLVKPSVDDLPEFLGTEPIDLVATKGDRLIAMKADDRGQDDNPVKLDVDLGVQSVIRFLKETGRLLHPETTRAALVMAWAAFEGAARLVLQREGKLSAAKSHARMVEEMWQSGHITMDEYMRLRNSIYLRNAIVHGSLPGDVPSALVPSILAIAKKLLKIAGQAAPARSSGASVTVIRKGIKEYPDLRQRVERADEALTDILKGARSTVSADWDIATEMRDRPVVVLRLSDSTGAVVAAFEPDELLDDERLKVRLNRVWGDLLEIRSHRQVERLLDAESAGQ